MLTFGLERASRIAELRGNRLVLAGENLPLIEACTKGRSSSEALRGVCRRAASSELPMDAHLYDCWVPTALNTAKVPSQFYNS